MGRYAVETTVTVEKSRAEIEQIARKYGASQFITGWDEGRAVIGFTMKDRQVKFILVLPSRTDERYTHNRQGNMRPITAQNAAWEQACRSSWRALAQIGRASCRERVLRLV